MGVCMGVPCACVCPCACVPACVCVCVCVCARVRSLSSSQARQSTSAMGRVGSTPQVLNHGQGTDGGTKLSWFNLPKITKKGGVVPKALPEPTVAAAAPTPPSKPGSHEPVEATDVDVVEVAPPAPSPPVPPGVSCVPDFFCRRAKDSPPPIPNPGHSRTGGQTTLPTDHSAEPPIAFRQKAPGLDMQRTTGAQHGDPGRPPSPHRCRLVQVHETQSTNRHTCSTFDGSPHPPPR